MASYICIRSICTYVGKYIVLVEESFKSVVFSVGARDPRVRLWAQQTAGTAMVGFNHEKGSRIGLQLISRSLSLSLSYMINAARQRIISS
jgi:hypothetical protein